MRINALQDSHYRISYPNQVISSPQLMNHKLILAFSSCVSIFILSAGKPHTSVLCIPPRNTHAATGSMFVKSVTGIDAEAREKRVEEEIIHGNFPDFMRELVRIETEITSPQGKRIKGIYYVMPDYLMIGSEEDFVRMPMQPKTAQKIADAFGFFLSTKKICDDVYRAATVKLEPLPLTADRESLATFLLHNQMIEIQRKGAKGLISGIKKDVIISSAITRHALPNRLALYGWHKPDGNPIQPVYAGHVDWYVDYSHGFRLVHRIIDVDGKPMDYVDVLKDPLLSRLICDEEDCSFTRYDTK